MRERVKNALEDLSRRERLVDADVARRVAADATLLSDLADRLRVGETSLFRDLPQWDALDRQVFPALARGGRVRALSVGCSTGEEAWTLAMLLGRHATPADLTVVGMDRNRAALEDAARGRFSAWSARNVPPAVAQRWLTRDGDELRVADELRPAVTFTLRDVTVGVPPGRWDVIVCKNVLIYFSESARLRALDALARALSARGVLVVARSEVPLVRATALGARSLGAGVAVFEVPA